VIAAQLGELRAWSGPIAAVLGSLALGLMVRRFAIPVLQRAAAKSKWPLDDILVYALREPILLVFLALGLRLAIRLLDVASATEQLVARVTLVIGIVALTWAVARFAAGATRLFAARGALPGVSILANAALFIVFLIGFLVALQTLGIAITPLITALGVGGLAVGLALQDTLANLFAGIRLLAGGRIRRGDYVKLESGHEGWVEDIAWAATTIREGANSMIIVPNTKLAQNTVVNYYLPDTEQIHVVNLGVAYGSDLDQVERAVIEEARQTQQSSRAGVPDFQPVLRFTAFGDFSVNLAVVLRTRNFPDRAGLQ